MRPVVFIVEKKMKKTTTPGGFVRALGASLQKLKG